MNKYLSDFTKLQKAVDDAFASLEKAMPLIVDNCFKTILAGPAGGPHENWRPE